MAAVQLCIQVVQSDIALHDGLTDVHGHFRQRIKVLFAAVVCQNRICHTCSKVTI